MKKEKSPILVIFCIFLLSLLVILPPMFRSMFPKEETDNNINEMQQPKIYIVNCNIIYPNELYQVNSRTNYTEGVSPVNKLTFTKLDVLPDTYTPSEIVPTTTVTEELTYLKSIPNIQIIENQNVTTITIDDAVISSIPDDQKIINYLSGDYSVQKDLFESIGYTCNIMES